MNWWWTVPLKCPKGFFFRSQYKWIKPFPHLNIALFVRAVPQMIARGKNASDLFPAVVKNVACKNIEVSETGSGSVLKWSQLFWVLLNLNLVLICDDNVVLLMSHSELKCWVTKPHETPHQSSVHQYMCVFSLRWRSWCMCISSATLKNSRISLCCPFPPSREDWRS